MINERKAGVVNMDPSIVGAFWLVSMLFILTPGADWAYAIAAGIREHRVAPAVNGMLIGHTLAIIIVAAGVGTLLARSPIAITLITAAGAAYVLYLGFGIVRTPSTTQDSKANPDAVATSSPAAAGLEPPTLRDTDTRSAWATKGLLVSGLNPKVFLLLLALLPQFTDASGSWPLSTQMLLLGGIHLIGTATIYYLVGFGAHAVTKTRPQAAHIMSKVSGVAMILVGALLIVGLLR